jgi:hypothetical protein
MLTNIPLEKLESSSNATVDAFENYNKSPIQLNNNVLTAMIGFLENNGFGNGSAESISIAIMTQAKKDGYNPMVILDTIKGLNGVELSALVAEILNFNRLKTSSLGIIQQILPVDNVKRNIVA